MQMQMFEVMLNMSGDIVDPFVLSCVVVVFAYTCVSDR